MSDPELHARATALFLELRSLPPSEHAAAAARAANGDERLRREVLSLLEHDVDEPASPGETPAFPAELGPYRVLAPIGQGGTGRVFLAEQLAPIRRRVAIKIVPQAASSAELAARFDFERRALERTEHPHIARILDAGRTRDGLPYLVMEYVEGVAITAYCDAHELAIEERIRLFLGVADAVHHAHQRGVIHRDIKPANVLVGEIDGRAVPRVLDFGIAKFVGARADEMGPPTSGLPVGTPAYMAPEQTGVGVVDTRADVYALGALLYELVAGRPPIEAAGGDLLATLERVRHDVPRPASSVAGTSVRLHAGRSFLRDLDCILAKALEKDPERRYPSVEALVDDLGRLQRCEPIAARAPSFGYRAARFAQRNRVLVGALGLASAALLLGLFGLALGLMEARRQRRAALEQMDAQAEVNRFLTEDLLGAASPERSGRDATVLDLLQRASQRIDERFAGRPLVAASIHQAVGGALGELGEFDAAERHLERALALRRASMGADSPDAVRTEITAASLLGRRERYAEARPVLEAAVTRARLFLGADAPELYTALNDLGVTLDSLGLPKDAEPVLMEALDGQRRLFGAEDPRVLTTLANLAGVYDGLGDTDRALATLLDAQRTAESMPDTGTTLLGLCNNIGATYQDLGRDEEAAPYLRRAAALALEQLGPDHPTTLSIQGNLAGLESDLGAPERAAELYRALAEARAASLGPAALDTLVARYGYWNSRWSAGHFEESAAGFEELLADVVDAFGEEHWLKAQTQSSLARALLDCGRASEALELAIEAEAQLEKLFGSDHHRTQSARAVVEAVRSASSGG